MQRDLPLMVYHMNLPVVAPGIKGQKMAENLIGRSASSKQFHPVNSIVGIYQGLRCNGAHIGSHEGNAGPGGEEPRRNYQAELTLLVQGNQ